MLNRDSLTLKLVCLASVVLGVLAQVSDTVALGFSPEYGEILLNRVKLLATVFAAVSGWLMTSPLKGENDDKRVGGGGTRSIVLPFLLAGSLLATGCGLNNMMLGGPITPGPAPVALSPEQVNQKAVEFAAVGTAVLGIAQQALELSHVIIPPSQLRLDINDAASALGRSLKDIATRAKSIVDEPTLRTVYREVLNAADAFLAALGKSSHPQLSEYSTAIRDKLQLIRTFLTGGAL